MPPEAVTRQPDVSRSDLLGGAVGDGIDFDVGNSLVQPAQTGLVDVSFKVNNVGRWLRSTQNEGTQTVEWCHPVLWPKQASDRHLYSELRALCQRAKQP